MANTWVPAYNSKAEFNSIVYAITDWTLSDTVNELDGTSTDSTGKYIPVAGIKKCTGNVKMNFDALKNPTQQASSAALMPGQAGTLELYEDATHIIVCDVMVTGINFTANVNGLLTFDFNYSGTVTSYPTYS